MPTNASRQVSSIGISKGQATGAGGEDCCQEAAAGAKTKIRNSTVASFRIATCTGNSAKLMASTTTFSAGEANMVAKTDSVLAPDANSPRAIGAMQLVHTASGTPATAPKTVFRKRDLVRRVRSVAKNVSAAGANRNENVMPMRLASSQLTVVRHTRTRSGRSRVTW